SELKIPFELAGRWIECEQRARIEVVAAARIAVPIRPGVARSPIDQVKAGIVRTCNPGRRASSLPTIPIPGFMSLFARSGDSPKSPKLLTGLCVIGIQQPADAGFSAADSNDDLSRNGKRRYCYRISELVAGDFSIPSDRSGPGIQSNQMAVKRAHIDHIVQYCHAPIRRAEPKHYEFLGQGPLPGPDCPAGASVQSSYFGRWFRHVHDAVD